MLSSSFPTMRSIVYAIFGVVSLFASAAQADQFLGESLVYTGSCRNTVVGLGDSCGFAAIRIDVLSLPMRISGITVTFENGVAQFIGVTPYITPGSSSGWKSLESAGNGCLRSVEVTGEAEGAPGAAAEIQVFGAGLM